MKKLLTIILAISLLAAGSALAAKVNGINISHADGFTVAQIDVDGEVNFTHQTEIAKDGKPFRIIVDVLGATHAMGAKVFENLPECQVSGIRSSQYAVDPENIVRIVLDMKSESAYRMDADDHSVKVYISDPDAVQFDNWSSHSSTPAPVTASAPATNSGTSEPTAPLSNDPASIIASINQAIAEDRMSSLETSADKPEESPKPAEKSETTTEKATTATDDTASTGSEPAPKTAAQILEEINSQIALDLEGPKVEEPVQKSEDKVESNPVESIPVESKPATGQPAETTSTLVGPQVPSNVTPEASPATTNEQDNKIEPEEPKEEIKSSSAPEKKSLLPKSPNKTKSDNLADTGTDKPVETGTIANDDSNGENSTARFRRDPRSRRIKGTMVAEFPTRLVIKYKGNIYRDPFETLINETKTHNNPMEVRIPNVEGLRLVGILESYEKGNSALFEDKTGYGFILKAGDKVQKGYVLRVDVDRVYFQIFEYGWSRTVALDMEIF